MASGKGSDCLHRGGSHETESSEGRILVPNIPEFIRGKEKVRLLVLKK